MTAEARPRTARALALSAALAAAATLVFSDGAAAAPQSCELSMLPAPADTASGASSLSDSGQYIVGAAYTTDPFDPAVNTPLLWQDGQKTEIPIAGLDQALTDVNDSGVAVGYAFTENGDVPYVYRDGQLTELPHTGGSWAEGINNDGVIIGSRDTDNGAVPVRWPADGGGPVDLALPDGALTGGANAIGADGTIVGSVDYDTASFPYKWAPDGTGSSLPIPEGKVIKDFGSAAYDINGQWAVGDLFSEESEDTVRWDLATGAADILDLHFANGVNVSGWVGGDNDEHAVLIADGTAITLPDNGGTDGFASSAADVNDAGDLVIGEVTVGENQIGLPYSGAAIWRCT